MKDKNLNKEIIVGVTSGLFMYWAQIATEEVMKLFGVEKYWWNIFFSFAFASFILFVFMVWINRKK